MDQDQDMMETYEGSTESDEDRLFMPSAGSYEQLVNALVRPLKPLR